MSKLSSGPSEELRFLAENVGVSLNVEQADVLIAFDQLLAKWTKTFNLVAVSTLSESITRHLLDSLSVGPFIQQTVTTPEEDAKVFDVLDVGSGAGLPVIPLAIAYPNKRFASIETNGKKVRFQRQAILELGLKNISVFHQRIEDSDAQAHVVLSRAFAAPDAFLTLTKSRCQEGGRAVVMLGQAELMPADLPAGWSLASMQRIDVPGEFAERHVAVCIRGTLAA